jgi:hypothetical protein
LNSDCAILERLTLRRKADAWIAFCLLYVGRDGWIRRAVLLALMGW